MKVIGNGSTFSFVIGIIIGMIGLAGLGINYPIYRKIRENGKQKYASDIMMLANEISTEE